MHINSGKIYDYKKFLIGSYNKKSYERYKLSASKPVDSIHMNHAVSGKIGWSDEFCSLPGMTVVRIQLENKQLYDKDENTQNIARLFLCNSESYNIPTE